MWLSAGTAYALAFPKAGLAFLGFVFLVPLLLACKDKKPAAYFRIFFCFSFLSHLILLYWIPRVMVKYGGTTRIVGLVGLVCLAAFLSFFSGMAGLLIGKFCESGACRGAVLWIPAAWIAKDLFIEKIFGGFPWCLAGYSQYRNIYFSQWAEIGGIHLVSFSLIAVNVLFFRLMKTRGKGTLLALLAVLFTIHAGGFGLLSHHAARTADIPFHQAGIVQPNSDHDQVFDFNLIKTVLENLFHSSLRLKSSGAEFVIWPEFTVPIYPLQTPFFKNQFIAFSESHIPLFAGFTDYHNSSEVFNSLILFNGRQIEKYDKVHLTPFGEYVPFRRLLFFVKKITDEIGDFTPGKKLGNIRLAGHSFSTPICYEVIYPELVRTLISGGGEVIVTVSNDSWFGRSAAPYQHLAMATFRSIENRRFLLRSTSNGISALVDPAGRIRHQAPLHQPSEFIASFQYLTERTVFTRWGYLFPYACFLLVLGKLAWMRTRKKISAINPEDYKKNPRTNRSG